MTNNEAHAAAKRAMKLSHQLTRMSEGLVAIIENLDKHDPLRSRYIKTARAILKKSEALIEEGQLYLQWV